MGYLGYLLTYLITWLLALLPGRLLYIFSDFLYLIVFYLIRYRKRVVTENISNAFPEYSSQKVIKTVRKFYHHLCDLILESAAGHFYSESRISRRMSFRNPELLRQLYKKGKPVIGVTAHYGNWEYLSLISRIAPYRVIGVYKKLKNPYFDRLIRRSREKFGVTTVPIEKIARKLISMKQEKEPSLSVFLSDQRPIWQHIQYWTRFMGIDTPLYLGTEKLARKLGAAVVFLKIRKVRRGIYETEFELITEDPRDLPPYQVTEAHVRILEGMIREAPQFWLWSHRRWKHSLEQYRKQHGEAAARRVSSRSIG